MKTWKQEGVCSRARQNWLWIFWAKKNILCKFLVRALQYFFKTLKKNCPWRHKKTPLIVACFTAPIFVSLLPSSSKSVQTRSHILRDFLMTLGAGISLGNSLMIFGGTGNVGGNGRLNSTEIINADGQVSQGPKLYISSTLNIDLILWHTQLIFRAENVESWVFPFFFKHISWPIHWIVCVLVCLNFIFEF